MEISGKTILIIDDEKGLRDSIRDYLSDMGCRTLEADNGESGLAVFRANKPDAILVDLNMPKVDGFAVVEAVHSEAPELPVVVLSGIGVLDKAVEAIRIGAWDFLTKPLSSLKVLDVTLSRVFERARLLADNRRYRQDLEMMVEEQVRKIVDLHELLGETQKEIIYRIGDVIETRSGETGPHVARVSKSAYRLSILAGATEEESREIEAAAPMHDAGKIGIPDAVLNKPGKLTDDEMNIMKTHSELGSKIFRSSSSSVLKKAAIIALYHHERWDGSGYPKKISADAIPFEARITSIVDVFDALSHKRCYKDAWPLEKVIEYIRENSGKMFDPRLTELFLNNLSEFLKIQEELKDKV